jgi:hypothetical protein
MDTALYRFFFLTDFVQHASGWVYLVAGHHHHHHHQITKLSHSINAIGIFGCWCRCIICH